MRVRSAARVECLELLLNQSTRSTYHPKPKRAEEHCTCNLQHLAGHLTPRNRRLPARAANSLKVVGVLEALGRDELVLPTPEQLDANLHLPQQQGTATDSGHAVLGW